MFDTGALEFWVTLPSGELLVGESLRRVAAAQPGPASVSALVALGPEARTEEERAVLAAGWAAVAAWTAAQAADAGACCGAGAGPAGAAGVRAAGAAVPAPAAPAGFLAGESAAVREFRWARVDAAQAVVEQAQERPAGPQVVTALASVDPRGLDESGPGLVGLVRAYERQISWLTARKLAAVAALVAQVAAAQGRDPADVAWDHGGGPQDRVARWARDELAAGLHVSRRTAADWVVLALDLRDGFPGVRAGLARGDLTVQQARALVAELPGRDRHADDPRDPFASVEDGVWAQAEARLVAAAARGLPPGRLRQLARATWIELDPQGAATRRRTRTRDQVGVSYRPLGDGLGAVDVTASAADAQALWQALEEHTRRRRMARGAPTDGGGGQPVGGRTGDVAAGAADAGCLRRPTLGQDRVATLRHLVVGGSADDRSAGAVCDGRGGSVPPAQSGADVRAQVQGNVQVQVVVDLRTLLGLAQRPGVIVGYGPIDPDLARTLAADADWTRWVTDPVTGHLLDDGTRRYPGARLRRFIRNRDPECVVPGCGQPARVADIDHLNGGYRVTGATRADQLAPTCVGHNRDRDEAGWQVRMEPDTTLHWTTALGQRLVVPPRRVLPETPPDPLDDPPSF